MCKTTAILSQYTCVKTMTITDAMWASNSNNNQDKHRYVTTINENVKSSPLDKIASISQTIFSNAFSWKISYFGSHFTEVCSLGSNWQQVIIGLGNELASNRRQVIIWNNAYPILGRIYATLEGDELISSIFIFTGICSWMWNEQ